jgi:hypothetical protein
MELKYIGKWSIDRMLMHSCRGSFTEGRIDKMNADTLMC